MRCPAQLRVLVAVLALTLVPVSLSALFVRPEIEQVPVDRVVRNLEAIAKREPQNVEVRVNLARAHAMAYVLGTETLPMARGRETSAGPWVQPPGRWVSFATDKPDSAASPAPAARAPLQAAVDTYEGALRLSPRDPIIRLGYG